MLNKIGKVKTTVLLLEYKKKHFGFQNPSDNDDLNLEYYFKEELGKINTKNRKFKILPIFNFQ